MPNGIIPAGQGFFVQTTTSSPSLTIPRQARVHSSQAYHGPSGTNEEGPPHAVFDLYFGDETDQVWITFSESCDDDYDPGWDVLKKMGDGTAPQLYFQHHNNELSIAAVAPEGEEGFVIPLQYEARQSGNHELMLSGQHDLDDYEIFLEDMELGEMQDLKQLPSYLFYSDSFNNPDRFILHFSPLVTGLQQENSSETVNIYSWNKAIYIVPNDGQGLGNIQLQVYDLYGRKIIEQTTKNAHMLRVPVAVSNTYLVVKVVQQGDIVVKKVFVQ